MSKEQKERDFAIRPSHDEIVGTAVRLLREAREHGIRTHEADHDPLVAIGKGNACQMQRCIEPHHLGGSGTATAFSGDTWLEGENFDVFADWNIHGARYDRIVAIFLGLFGRNVTIDLTDDLKPHLTSERGAT